MTVQSAPTRPTPRTHEVDALIDELRARLAELPAIYAASRSTPVAAGRSDGDPTVKAKRAGAFPLRRAIVLGRTLGILAGAGVFRALSTHL
jgi:hypothetical protein